MHIIVDGYAKNTRLLTNVRVLRLFLVQTVAAIGMKQISNPIVIEYPAGNGEERGLSGIIFLAESNITVHTYPEYNFLFTDVFSCRAFDFDTLVTSICIAAGISTPKILRLDRGIENDIITPARLRGE